jgi:4-amino-4-deoxy-L-arabinose transferase-like glycosyltransferase
MKPARAIPVLPAAVILLGSLVLLFARLGHYCLWDDEAITAMTARAVLHTGDTSARVDDHNLLIYRNGLLVRNFKDRYTPPLQFYFIAPFIKLLGDGNFACRLPFALCGVATVAFLLLWLTKLKASPLVWWSAAAILLTNASFFLFFRQCRYYGLAMLLTTAIAFFYCNRDGKTRWFIALSLALAALLASQYLDYAAVVGCLMVDYIVWGRKRPISLRGWLIILLPQLIVGGVVLSVWNLSFLHTEVAHGFSPVEWIHDRFLLWWWNWRDMFACDFGILLLILACPLLYLKHRSIWMLRAPVGLFVFVSTLAFAVPTSLASTTNAEVRYLAPAIPLCIAVAIVAVWGLQFVKPAMKWAVLVLAAASVLIESTPEAAYASDKHLPVPFYFHSTTLLYYQELMVPQTESYTPVIDWINANVPAGSSIYVQPAYKNYPLMLRAGKAVYAWQLDDTREIFTLAHPAKGESPTLELLDESGRSLAEISTFNGVNPTPESVAAALVAAWNDDPHASMTATAKGDGTAIILLPTRGGLPLVNASVRNAKTGTLTKSIIKPRADFATLPDIHFFGRVAPDYMIRFGSNGESGDFPVAIQMLETRDIQYQLVQTIHLHWKDYYRPERIWRSFVTRDPDAVDEICIYRKMDPD